LSRHIWLEILEVALPGIDIHVLRRSTEIGSQRSVD
jgi:hypothetical protein